jgi:hypothetical protein
MLRHHCFAVVYYPKLLIPLLRRSALNEESGYVGEPEETCRKLGYGVPELPPDAPDQGGITVIGEGERRAVVTAIYVQPRATGSLELSGPITIHVSYCIVFYRIVFA